MDCPAYFAILEQQQLPQFVAKLRKFESLL